MARIDYIDDPDVPKANSVVPSVVAAVLDDQGKVLLIHKTVNDLWALPGGAGGSARTSSESKRVEWVDPGDVEGLPVQPSMRMRLQHALDEREQPYIG